MNLNELILQLREFARERDWERYHTPKNLAMAMSVEMAELVEHFQWLTADESQAVKDAPDKLQAISEEMADILLYLVRMADVLGVDLDQATQRKLVLNALKYPPITKV
ncbi:NTP pyrophosphatase, house-cleaning of non-canonical NTPs [Formivibrio citricus]|uniref:NTP pyrophosphatase, house-cleaning of non-canonical NTPs n=1 Tax=Formivibrio citricus TaxID=83765 RepID=A0A1I4XHB8_9NEIS|nr:nucleotide pyrophosphohydrolase [Formivibrio citricus]SFN25175.1 NTP pyrophosphatase, house-cleaning of non-canonical NTPs [Formivibrio citricus]